MVGGQIQSDLIGTPPTQKAGGFLQGLASLRIPSANITALGVQDSTSP